MSFVPYPMDPRRVVVEGCDDVIDAIPGIHTIGHYCQGEGSFPWDGPFDIDPLNDGEYLCGARVTTSFIQGILEIANELTMILVEIQVESVCNALK